MASSTTRPKFDRQILSKEKEPESKPIGVRKIPQIASLANSFRPRGGTFGKRDLTVSVSSRDRHYSDHDRISHSSLDFQNRSIKYENTFKLEPDIKFQAEKVQKVIFNVLENELEGIEYDPITSANNCVILSDTIKEKVKLLNMKRYKIICSVVITEKANQSLNVASRFCWDKDRDNFASAHFNQPNLHAVGTVYGIYVD